MSISPQTILAKILRSSRSIKEVLICDKVGLVISKVLRISPIEGLGAMESSCYKAAQEICEFLNLGKEVVHISVFPKLAIIGIEIGLGYLIILLDHNDQFSLNTELISSSLNDLVNMWINELGLQGFDFSMVKGVADVLPTLYKGTATKIGLYQEALEDFDVIDAVLRQVNNPLILVQSITNELGLPIAFHKQGQINIEADAFSGGLLTLDAVVKEKGESTGLGAPIFSAVFTDQKRGVLTCHAGLMDNEPLIYQCLFDLKEGFLPILSEAGTIINTIGGEYGDEKTKLFLDTLKNIINQLAPEGAKEEIVRAGEVIEKKPTELSPEPVKNLIVEMEKNISESISYYMTQLSELMELVVTRSKELRTSIEGYDADLANWIESNLPTFAKFGLDANCKQEYEKWIQAKKIIFTKLEQLEKE
ncbi:MAG: roadblock/LC7 domain-containing protein [Candidatus Helarchaeales archaeon]